jgi:glyoxalase family protein
MKGTQMENNITGIHHITAMAGNPQTNYDFYTHILGLRFIKKTVNFDAPDVYHFYYGDETGTPGTILTFFPFPDARRGKRGTGEISKISFRIPANSLDYWVDRLSALAVSFNSPSVHFGYPYLSFLDPDGMMVELVADPIADSIPGWNNGDIQADHSIRNFFGVEFLLNDSTETETLLSNVLGFKFIESINNIKRYSTGDGSSLSFIDLKPNLQIGPPQNGAGTVHHIAWRTANDETQNNWRNKIIEHGLFPTEQRDRNYFRSIYFREPGGILFEIATDEPGFLIDEDFQSLGTELKLPEWYESKRDIIESQLYPLVTKETIRK